MLTVAQLIAKLKRFDPSRPVFGYDGTDSGARPIAVYEINSDSDTDDTYHEHGPYVVIDVD